jgi:hypothetical protein
MIKSFKIFESYQEIKSICDKYGIRNWELNPETNLVDVEGSVDLSRKELREIPIKFGRVGGNFNCYNNKLTTLEGAPNSVGGDFYCTFNKLTSLEGAPLSVGGGFYCRDNQLTSLEGAPNSVGGNFNCGYNQLTSLEGCPKSVGGGFYCQNNKLRDFKVPYGSLNESKEFNCERNPIFEVYELFNHPRCVDVINEWEILDGEEIVRIRLEEVFLDMGMEIPERLEFIEWKLK